MVRCCITYIYSPSFWPTAPLSDLLWSRASVAGSIFCSNHLRLCGFTHFLRRALTSPALTNINVRLFGQVLGASAAASDGETRSFLKN